MTWRHFKVFMYLLLERAGPGAEEGWAARLLLEEWAAGSDGLVLDGATPALLQVGTGRVLGEEAAWEAFLERTSATLE
jgi:hypothetical protein